LPVGGFPAGGKLGCRCGCPWAKDSGEKVTGGFNLLAEKKTKAGGGLQRLTEFRAGIDISRRVRNKVLPSTRWLNSRASTDSARQEKRILWPLIILAAIYKPKHRIRFWEWFVLLG